MGEVNDDPVEGDGDTTSVTTADGTTLAIPTDPAQTAANEQAARNTAAAQLPTVPNTTGADTGVPVNIYDQVVLDPYSNVGLPVQSGVATNEMGGSEPRYAAPDSKLETGTTRSTRTARRSRVVRDIPMEDMALARTVGRRRAPNPPATDDDNDVRVSSGQRPANTSDRTTTTTQTRETKARSTATKVAIGLGWTALGVVVVGAVSVLTWVFAFGGQQVIKDHFADKADPTAPTLNNTFSADNDRTKPVTVDVLAGATKGTGTILASTVQILTGTDANGLTWAKTKTAAGEGVWRVDATSGKITFTADASFKMGNPTPITIRVFDDQVPPKPSNSAVVSVVYKDSPTPPVMPLPVDGPVTQDQQSLDNVVGADVVVNVLTGATAAAGLDPASVRIVTGSNNGKTLTVGGQGSWLVGATGTITFKPEKPTYPGNPNAIQYVVADLNGLVSQPKMVTVTYKAGITPMPAPVALNIAITDYDFPPVPAGGPVAQTPLPTRVDVLDYVMSVPGGAAIDPQSALLHSTLTPVGVGGNPNAVYTNPVQVKGVTIGYRTVTVPDQGIWIIADSKDTPPVKQVVFTPNAGVMGAPTAVYYTVADTTGIRSNPARIVLYEQLDALFKAIDASLAKTDDDFWTDFNRDVVATTTDIDAFMAVVNALEVVVRASLGANATVVFTNGVFPQISGTGLQTLVTEWTNAKLTTASLFAIAAREVTAAKTHPGSPPLATRANRLNLMRRMYRAYLAQLVQMMGSGT